MSDLKAKNIVIKTTESTIRERATTSHKFEFRMTNKLDRLDEGIFLAESSW